MDMKNLAKQTMVLNKTAINNGFNAMIMAQAQMGIMTDTFFSQIPGFPQAGTKAIGNWAKVYRNGCDQLRKTIVESIDQIEGYFDA